MRKLIKKILKEDDWDFVRDIKSNQDIAQEIADETKIKNNLLHTPSLILQKFPFIFFSPSTLPLLLSPARSFIKYGKEQYGLDNEDDINDVWERYKKLVKYRVNNLNESDDLQWLKDIPALVDITPGMCLRDQQGTQWITMNPNNYPKTDKNKWAWLLRTHTEGQKMIRRQPHPFKRVDLNDRLVVGDLSLCDNTLKESDELDWIRDIDPYIPFGDAQVGAKYGVQVMDRYLFEDVIDGCGDMIEGIPNYIIVNKKAILNYNDVYCVNRDSNVIPYWDGTKECLRLEFYSKQGSFLLDHWLAPDDLIRLKDTHKNT